MLKKAGIAAAAATAGLLAFSPLAFATGDSHKGDVSQTGVVNLNDTTVQANACGNNINVIGISDLTGALGLAGPAEVHKKVSCSNEND